MASRTHISPELKELVSRSVKLLGQAVEEIHGKELYQQIEKLRLQMKAVRGKEPAVVRRALEAIYEKLRKFDDENLHQTAKAFSLMLELINTCEAAYRSHRLRDFKAVKTRDTQSLIFVFTSHPTEARSRDFLSLMRKIEELLAQSLEDEFQVIEEHLLHLLRIAVRINLANDRRPTVKDEADQIFHTVLDPAILKEQIALHKKGIDVLFRTWVGGDKDGHPLVGPETMLQSLTLSRQGILRFIRSQLEKFREELRLLPSQDEAFSGLGTLLRELQGLRQVSRDDGKRVAKFKKLFERFLGELRKKNLISPAVSDIEHLIWIYPALVLPLEVREDSELIHKALTIKRQTISRMIVLLKSISTGMNPKWYVRGFVISMCTTASDMLAAVKLLDAHLGGFKIPVVPLFENEAGLAHAPEILTDAFKHRDFQKTHRSQWGSRFEVMVGYSDSSKENGVLPGRLLIQKALFEIEEFILARKLIPVFFHGSGGSVSRGGGSIKEQIAWLPPSALNIYKVTIQGETVQRHFQQPLIMRSQVSKIVEEFNEFKPRSFSEDAVLRSFAAKIQSAYRDLVNDPEFHDLISAATPYDFLNQLKIGSRPTKRSGTGKFTLRAIPWILCWTQTRLLLPVWWGVGGAWAGLSAAEKKKFKTSYLQSPLLQTYVKQLGFTLAKIEQGVWEFHMAHSGLSPQLQKSWNERISSELAATTEFFHDVTGGSEFTWFRPWLLESILFRSSMIHPLNVIQKIALERNDKHLLRETVTGIACGMMTTG